MIIYKAQLGDTEVTIEQIGDAYRVRTKLCGESDDENTLGEFDDLESATAEVMTITILELAPIVLTTGDQADEDRFVGRCFRQLADRLKRWL